MVANGAVVGPCGGGGVNGINGGIGSFAAVAVVVLSLSLSLSLSLLLLLPLRRKYGSGNSGAAAAAAAAAMAAAAAVAKAAAADAAVTAADMVANTAGSNSSTTTVVTAVASLDTERPRWQGQWLRQQWQRRRKGEWSGGTAMFATVAVENMAMLAGGRWKRRLR